MDEGHVFAGEAAAINAAAITLVQGSSFAICDRSGDITGNYVDGVFVGDTRICSHLVLYIDGARVQALAATNATPFGGAFVGRSPDRSLLIFRDHWVGRGMRADVRVRNLTGTPSVVELRYELDADLAGLFAVKEGRAGILAGEVAAPPIRTATRHELVVTADDGTRAVAFVPSDGAEVSEAGIVWQVEVPKHGEWSCCLEIVAIRSGERVVPRHRCGQPPDTAEPAARQAAWGRGLPRLTTDIPGLEIAVDRAGIDLGALRLFDTGEDENAVVAAGAPWYMTLFGRDAIITSWMALVLKPALGLATARTLARLQGREDDDISEEQPGRILHEVRAGRGASLALADGEVYYGTADATPLFVMLVAELYRWGVAWDDLEPLLPAVDAALAWMQGPGDLDGDGYVEYRRRTTRGLRNQGWKDSFDGISFADARLADPPIALAEVQAYCFAAWRGAADLAAAAGDVELADQRRAKAGELQVRFNRDFWLEGQQALALGLDADKVAIDSVASNMGHCLWAGIVDTELAPMVAKRLMARDMFSGWGLRTLSSSMARYDPVSYHNGSVWPHDSAIGVAGLRRYGFDEEAARLARGLLVAATAGGGRLPELFAGLTPEEMPVPVAYPASCVPQAWASAAPLLILRSILGLEPDVPAGRVDLDPLLPAPASRLRLSGMPFAGGEITIDVEGDAVAVRGVPRGLAVVRPA